MEATSMADKNSTQESHPAPITCMTCERPWPERTEPHPFYLGQSSTRPGSEHVWFEWGDTVSTLLEYAAVVSLTLTDDLAKCSDADIKDFGFLVNGLCRE